MVSVLLTSADASAPNAMQSSFGNLYDMILAGGPIMVPIALCSVVALALLVERWSSLSRGRLAPGSFHDELEKALAQSPKQALELCEQQPRVAIARVLAVGLRRWSQSRDEIERGVEDAGGREVTAMTRRLRPLFVITTVAPLLGLLGTVMGMINAFRALAFTTGVAKPQLLAGGISQALVTTAAGLVVAIPAQCAYFWLKAKVEKFGNSIEHVFENVIAKRLVARADVSAATPATAQAA